MDATSAAAARLAHACSAVQRTSGSSVERTRPVLPLIYQWVVHWWYHNLVPCQCCAAPNEEARMAREAPIAPFGHLAICETE